MGKIDLKSRIQATAASTVTSGLLKNEGIKENILILPVLKELIKALTTDEYEGLRANIIQNGCQDSLKIWQTTRKVIDAESATDEEIFVLIDGHNRYQICKETNTPFNITLMKFESLDNVKDWMVTLQLSRRNISSNELAYYRGLLYRNALKEDAANVGENFTKKEGVRSEKKSTKIAEQFNVDEKTIRRDGDYSEGIKNLSDNLKKEVLSGNVKVAKQKIQDLGKIDIESKVQTIQELEAVLEVSTTKAIEVNETNDTQVDEPLEIPNKDNDAEVNKVGKKNTIIPLAQRVNLESKFKQFMKTENIDDLVNFQKLMKAVEKQIK